MDFKLKGVARREFSEDLHGLQHSYFSPLCPRPDPVFPVPTQAGLLRNVARSGVGAYQKIKPHQGVVRLYL